MSADQFFGQLKEDCNEFAAVTSVADFAKKQIVTRVATVAGYCSCGHITVNQEKGNAKVGLIIHMMGHGYSFDEAESRISLPRS